MSVNKLYLDDLQIGQRFVSGEAAVTASAIKAFAQEFDPQPFHLDEEAARASFFRGLAASGWHVAALTMRLNVESLPIAGGIIGMGVELAWTAPTRPGDVLHVESEVQSITPSKKDPNRAVVAVLSRTVNKRGETVQSSTARLWVPRRASEE